MALRGPNAPRYREVEVAWKPAGDGWTTLNSDGSVLSDNRSAVVGLVIQDSRCHVQHAAAINLCSCSITRAEMRRAVEGMEKAWDLGVRRLEVQMDSTTAINILTQGVLGHQHASLVTHFQRLKARDWETRLVHVYREANHLADYLANKGHSIPVGSTTLCSDDPEVKGERFTMLGGD
ncbi:Putative ribonuclease H protein At1g65750 [Linum perenne]